MSRVWLFKSPYRSCCQLCFKDVIVVDRMGERVGAGRIPIPAMSQCGHLVVQAAVTSRSFVKHLILWYGVSPTRKAVSVCFAAAVGNLCCDAQC